MLKQKPANRNSKRSISLITEAMIQLMEEIPFQEISISQITKEAGLVRNTFYSHFQKKEDVLSNYMFDCFREKLEQYDLKKKEECIDFVALYFNFWGENTDYLELLEKHDLLIILNSLEYHINELNIDSYLNEICTISETAMKYSNSVYANTMASILKTWIKTGKQESPEELAKVFYELFSY